MTGTSTLIFDDNVADETYFILRAKESFPTNLYESKAWLIAAKTLFPHNFHILFEAYLVDKRSESTKDAADSFSVLFTRFLSENDFWIEVRNLIMAMLSENPTEEQQFLKDMFLAMPSQIQHDLLSITSERSEDPMEHCRLALLVLNKFPHTLEKLGVHLVETLITAEKHSHCQTILNPYRQILVCDLIPLLLENDELDLSTKLLVKMLHKMIGYYVTYFTNSLNKINENTDINGVEIEYVGNNTELTWEKLFSLLTLFGNRLDYELLSLFVYPWLVITMVLSVFTFYSMLGGLAYVTKNKSSLVLVEAFIPRTITEMVSESPFIKRTKSEILNRPVVTVGNDAPDILGHFLFAVKCWEMIHSSEQLQKEFLKLKQHIHLDACMKDFLVDIALYHEKIEEFSVKYESENNIRTVIKKLSYNYYLNNHNVSIQSTVDCIIQVIKQLELIPKCGSILNDITKSVGRHLYFLPIEKLPILQYTIKILISVLFKSLQITDSDKNRIYCELITVSQLNWPAEYKIAQEVFKQIREHGSFVFPSFSKFIINVELLEEFADLLSNNTHPVFLDITMMPVKWTEGKMDGELQDALKKFLRCQVKRWHDSVHPIIIDFLLHEENYLRRLCIIKT